MQLPKAPAQYDGADQAQMRGILEREDRRNIKAGAVFDQILLRDAATGGLVRLSVVNGGVVVT